MDRNIIENILKEFGYNVFQIEKHHYSSSDNSVNVPLIPKIMCYHWMDIGFTGIIRDKFCREINLDYYNSKKLIVARYTRYLEPVVDYDVLFMGMKFNLHRSDSIDKFEDFLSKEHNDLSDPTNLRI